eukprot:gb/GECG01001009.1/.p1 GENE.gb/GECG01001009.1/~~gb/GECG01001009.1/.p1  ORF type:complete len:1636 (+),score=255.30 gb/GECG01001009.1/:1-4908(+)
MNWSTKKHLLRLRTRVATAPLQSLSPLLRVSTTPGTMDKRMRQLRGTNRPNVVTIVLQRTAIEQESGGVKKRVFPVKVVVQRMSAIRNIPGNCPHKGRNCVYENIWTKKFSTADYDQTLCKIFADQQPGSSDSSAFQVQQLAGRYSPDSSSTQPLPHMVSTAYYPQEETKHSDGGNSVYLIELNKLRKKNHTYKHLLKQSRSDIKEMQKIVDDAAHTQHNQVEEKTALSRQLENVKHQYRDMESSYKERLDQLQQQISQFKEENARLKDQNSMMEQREGELKSQMQRLEQDVERGESRIAELNEQIKDKQKEMDRLNESLASEQTSQERVRQLQEELRHSLSELTEAKQGSKLELQQLRDRNKTLEAKVSDLENRIVTLHEEAAGKKHLEKENADLRESRDSFKQQVDSLREQYWSERERSLELNYRCKQAEGEINKVQTDRTAQQKPSPTVNQTDRSTLNLLLAHRRCFSVSLPHVTAKENNQITVDTNSFCELMDTIRATQRMVSAFGRWRALTLAGHLERAQQSRENATLECGKLRAIIAYLSKQLSRKQALFQTWSLWKSLHRQRELQKAGQNPKESCSAAETKPGAPLGTVAISRTSAISQQSVGGMQNHCGSSHGGDEAAGFPTNVNPAEVPVSNRQTGNNNKPPAPPTSEGIHALQKSRVEETDKQYDASAATVNHGIADSEYGAPDGMRQTEGDLSHAPYAGRSPSKGTVEGEADQHRTILASEHKEHHLPSHHKRFTTEAGVTGHVSGEGHSTSTEAMRSEEYQQDHTTIASEQDEQHVSSYDMRSPAVAVGEGRLDQQGRNKQETLQEESSNELAFEAQPPTQEKEIPGDSFKRERLREHESASAPNAVPTASVYPNSVSSDEGTPILSSHKPVNVDGHTTTQCSASSATLAIQVSTANCSPATPEYDSPFLNKYEESGQTGWKDVSANVVTRATQYAEGTVVQNCRQTHSQQVTSVERQDVMPMQSKRETKPGRSPPWYPAGQQLANAVVRLTKAFREQSERSVERTISKTPQPTANKPDSTEAERKTSGAKRPAWRFDSSRKPKRSQSYGPELRKKHSTSKKERFPSILTRGDSVDASHERQRPTSRRRTPKRASTTRSSSTPRTATCMGRKQDAFFPDAPEESQDVLEHDEEEEKEPGEAAQGEEENLSVEEHAEENFRYVMFSPFGNFYVKSAIGSFPQIRETWSSSIDALWKWNEHTLRNGRATDTWADWFNSCVSLRQSFRGSTSKEEILQHYPLLKSLFTDAILQENPQENTLQLVSLVFHRLICASDEVITDLTQSGGGEKYKISRASATDDIKRFVRVEVGIQKLQQDILNLKKDETALGSQCEDLGVQVRVHNRRLIQLIGEHLGRIVKFLVKFAVWSGPENETNEHSAEDALGQLHHLQKLTSLVAICCSTGYLGVLLETSLAFESSLNKRCKFCKSKMFHTWLQFLSQEFTREVLSHAATHLSTKSEHEESDSSSEKFSSKMETAFNMLNRPSEGFVTEDEAKGNESALRSSLSQGSSGILPFERFSHIVGELRSTYGLKETLEQTAVEEHGKQHCFIDTLNMMVRILRYLQNSLESNPDNKHRLTESVSLLLASLLLRATSIVTIESCPDSKNRLGSKGSKSVGSRRTKDEV